jgi:hypothetical protein
MADGGAGRRDGLYPGAVDGSIMGVGERSTGAPDPALD